MVAAATFIRLLYGLLFMKTVHACCKERMKFLHVLILATFTALSSSQCFLNRLREYPCKPRVGVKVPKPGTNEYGVYSTRIRSIGGRLACILRRRGHIIRHIDDITNSDTKLIFSPGYERQPKQKYINQMLVEYNISCGPSKGAFLTLSFLKLEPPNCFVPASGKQECQDYVQVVTENGGVKEFCGENLSPVNIFISTGSFRIILRTSDRKRFAGFTGYAVCSKNIHSKDICTRVEPTDMYASRYQLETITPRRYESLKDSEELLDITALDGPHSNYEVPRITISEKKVLDLVVSKYIAERLKDAREDTPVWPPPEFEDEIDDLVATSPLPFTPIIEPERALPEKPEPHIPTLPDHTSRLQKRFTDSLTNRVAIAYQDACNPILHSAAKSFISYVRRNAPEELRLAEDQLSRDQESLPQLY